MSEIKFNYKSINDVQHEIIFYDIATPIEHNKYRQANRVIYVFLPPVILQHNKFN